MAAGVRYLVFFGTIKETGHFSASLEMARIYALHLRSGGILKCNRHSKFIKSEANLGSAL